MDMNYAQNLEKLLKAHGANLAEKSQSIGLLESLLLTGADTREWVSGKAKNPPISTNAKSAKAFNDLFLDLSSWSPSLRRAVIEYCKGNDLPVEDKFSLLRLESSPQEELKNGGAVFTPLWLADYITSLSFQYWGQLHRTGKKPESIADLSCGTGVFLSSIRKYYGKDPVLFGQDIDGTSLRFAELLSLGKNLNANINNKDTLLGESLFEKQNRKFDIIIGNPPYIRGANLKPSYAQSIQKQFPDVVYGNFDLVVPFIKRSSDLLEPGGIISYIVSSKFMHSKYGKGICEYLATKVRLINIVDFKDAQLFDGYTTYTSIITFAKLKPVEKLSVTYFPGQFASRDDIRKSKKFTISRKNLESFPWNLSTSENQAILDKIFNDKNPRITAIFPGILQGVRTGLNEAFIVPRGVALNQKFERGYFYPYLNGECIKRGESQREKYCIIYPYYKEGSDIGLVSEQDLSKRAPNIYKYLTEKKELLIEAGGGTNWHGYSRPQNLILPFRKKILVKEMMPRAEFAADTDGNAVITSGYAIVANNMEDKEIIMWSWILNTPTMEFVLRQSGTQLHSGWFRLMKNHLDRVRLPNLTDLQKKKIRKEIQKYSSNTDKLLKKLDAIVISSFALTKEEITHIEAYLKSQHSKSLSEKVEEKTPKKGAAQDNSFYYPVRLEKFDKHHSQDYTLRQLATFQKNKATPIHRWYSFTQGFSDGLVEYLIKKMGIRTGDTVLDPFAGTGTTLLSCNTRGIESLGVEISPFLTWVSDTKVASLEIKKPERLVDLIENIDTRLLRRENKQNLIFDDYFSKAFAPKIIAQIINLNQAISSLEIPTKEKAVLRLALISILEDISQIRKHGSHYRFLLNENSIGLQKLNTKIINPDSDILPIYKKKLSEMISDITTVRERIGKKIMPSAVVINGDIRSVSSFGGKPSHVITSPPYLNRNNYIAQQKAELALLSFIKNKEEYKELVRKTFRSHTDSDLHIENPSEIDAEVNKIISNITLSENNNPKIPEMVAGYFLDLKKTLNILHHQLAKGAKLAFVVGNSRWGGVVVPVDHLLANMAEKIGFKVNEIIITRHKGNSPQQMRRYGKIPVRESIVLFERT